MTPSVWAIHDSSGPGGRPSGCGWYRIILPFEQLKANGWRANYSAEPPFEAGDESDILVGQRLDSPMAAAAWDALGSEYPLVYEIDDNPFVLDEVNWLAVASGYNKTEVLGSIRKCAEVSDVVTVSSPMLAEFFSQFSENAVCLPNYVPGEILAHERPRHEKLTIGWTGGVSHGRDMALIAQTWRDVMDASGVRGHFQGTDYRNMLRHRGFDFTPWTPDQMEYLRTLDFDIGLAPIAPHRFSDYKTPIKAIEYGALGIPVIASNRLPYSEYVIDGVTGFLCDTQEQWRNRMELLIYDEQLRSLMGRRAREQAAQYTIERNWWRWAEVYSKLWERRSHE